MTHYLGVTPIRGGGRVFGVRGVEWVVKVVGVRWVEGVVVHV